MNLQTAVDDFIAATQKGAAASTSYYVFPLPTQPYRTSRVIGGSVGNRLALFLSIGVIVVMYAFLSSVLSERESKIREGMRMMGLSDFGYYSGTYVFAILWGFFILAFATVA